MAPTAYLTLTGKKQGAIKGGVAANGREGSIALIAVGYGVSIPLDPASGQSTGKREHKPVVVSKAVDEASPQLLQALVTNETLTDVKIDFWRPSPESVAPYFSIALTNAIVTDVTLNGSAGQEPREIEQVQFVYQQISWTWVASGASARDDWNVPA